MEEKPVSINFIIFWIAFFIALVALANWWSTKGANSIVSSSDKGGLKQLVLQADRQHHYRVQGMINNHPVNFLLDTGATSVAIPKTLADKAGLVGQYPVTVKTANGLAQGQLARIKTLTLGPIVLHNVSAIIMGHNSGQHVLLGMSALKKLELRQQDNQLTLIQRDKP